MTKQWKACNKMKMSRGKYVIPIIINALTFSIKIDDFHVGIMKLQEKESPKEYGKGRKLRNKRMDKGKTEKNIKEISPANINISLCIIIVKHIE